MRITEVDGVPVFWLPAPGPLTAGLAFGCGTRDETFMTIGVTRLLKNLVMSALPGTDHDIGATVDLFATEFVATGPPDAIVAFLRAVCAAIATPPLDRISLAAALDAESDLATHPTTATLLTRRFGARDVGLESYAGPGPHHLTAADVAAHATRFFVRGNAVLWLTGPPPDGLALPLPAGEKVRRTEPVPLAQDGPRWSREMIGAPGILLSGQDDPAWTLAMAILVERIRYETGRLGLSDHIFDDALATGPRSRQYLVGADARSGEDDTVAEILWHHVRHLADPGPTDEELADRKALVEANATEAGAHARAVLLDLPLTTPAECVDRIASVTRADVAAVVAAALPTARLAVPPGITPSLPGMASGGCPTVAVPPAGRTFRMTLAVRVIARIRHPSRVYLGPTGIAVGDPDGDIHATTFADVIGAEYDGGLRRIYTTGGCVLLVVPTAYRDGEAIEAAIDQRIPASVRYAPGGGPVPAPSSLDAVNRVLAERPRWYRRVSLLAAVLLALATAVLYANWRIGYLPAWTAIVGAVVTVGVGWDARPRRRSKQGSRR